MTSTYSTDNPECIANWCGHVDSTAGPDEHGSITPHDWEALVTAIEHAVGTIPTCESCYFQNQEQEDVR